jgi:hypothetical protein
MILDKINKPVIFMNDKGFIKNFNGIRRNAIGLLDIY